MKKKIIVVTYHFVMDFDSRFPGLKCITKDQFKEQLDYLCKHHNPLSLEDLRSFVEDGQPLADNGFLLTFDHGTKDHLLNVSDELVKRGIKGTFFLMTSTLENGIVPVIDKQRFLEARFRDYRIFYGRFYETVLEVAPELAVYAEPTNANLRSASKYLVEVPYYNDYERLLRKFRDCCIEQSDYDRIVDELACNELRGESISDYYMNWNDVVKLKDLGMDIGSHCHSHIIYSKSTGFDCLKDVETSVQILRKRFGQKSINAIAYPNGEVNPQLIDSLSSSGIVLGFTVESGIFIDSEKPFLINRIDTNYLPYDHDAHPNYWSRMILGNEQDTF